MVRDLKNKVLPGGLAWAEPKGIILNEISIKVEFHK